MLLDKQKLKSYPALIGVDEVGRGPLAGPVITCAVKIKSNISLKKLFQLGIKDSKKLTSLKRKKILRLLEIDLSKVKLNQEYKTAYFSFCLSSVSPKMIDRINILQASLLGMKKCSEKLCDLEDLILVDGNFKLKTRFHCEAIIKGDSKYLVISLASIIAKEFRDEKMKKLSQKFPDYQWQSNAGYPTKDHLNAIKEKGITAYHRKSFRGVREHI